MASGRPVVVVRSACYNDVFATFSLLCFLEGCIHRSWPSPDKMVEMYSILNPKALLPTPWEISQEHSRNEDEMGI